MSCCCCICLVFVLIFGIRPKTMVRIIFYFLPPWLRWFFFLLCKLSSLRRKFFEWNTQQWNFIVFTRTRCTLNCISVTACPVFFCRCATIPHSSEFQRQRRRKRKKKYEIFINLFEQLWENACWIPLNLFMVKENSLKGAPGISFELIF